jgi:hypothetical protein
VVVGLVLLLHHHTTSVDDDRRDNVVTVFFAVRLTTVQCLPPPPLLPPSSSTTTNRGKHRMAAVKDVHVAPQMGGYNKDYILPIVVIRHPLAWLQSMCAHPYAASWRHNPAHCPNFIPNEIDHSHFPKATSFPVTVQFDVQDHVTFDSLIHLWNEWYRQYLNVDYPIVVGTYVLCRVW